MPQAPHTLEIDRSSWEGHKKDALGIMKRAKATQEEMVLQMLFNAHVKSQLDQEAAQLMLDTREKLLTCLPRDITDTILKETNGPLPSTLKPREDNIWLQHIEERIVNKELILQLATEIDAELAKDHNEDARQRAFEGIEDILYLNKLISEFSLLKKRAQTKLRDIEADNQTENELSVKIALGDELTQDEARKLEALRKDKNNEDARKRKRVKLNAFLDELDKITIQSLIFNKEPSAKEMKINLDFMKRKKIELTDESTGMIEQITPDLIFTRAQEAVEQLRRFLAEAPVDFTLPEKETLDIISLFKTQYAVIFREEIQEVLEPKKKEKKKKAKKKTPRKLPKPSKLQLGCLLVLALGAAGVYGISQIPPKPKPTPITEDDRPNRRPSYPVIPPRNNATNQPPQNNNANQNNQPESNQNTPLPGPHHVEQVSEKVWRVLNITFTETHEHSQLQYEGNFDYEITLLNEGSVQFNLSKQGGSMLNPNNMMISCYFVVSDGRIIMGALQTVTGREEVDLRGINPYIPSQIKVAFNIFLQSNVVRQLPENFQNIIIGR